MKELGLCRVRGQGVTRKIKAAYVLWDEVQDADCSMCKSIEPFTEHKFNKRCEGALKK